MQTSRQTGRALSQIRDALKSIQREVLSLFDSVERQEVTVNKRYEYQLDASVIERINEFIDEILQRYIMLADGGDPIIIRQIELAYQQGAAAAVTNLTVQSEDIRRAIEDTLRSPAYRNRIALVRARVFEEMRGFTDTTRTDLARTLADGMAQGQGPREVAGTIRGRIGVAQSRAERIARTEINNAHRRAVWDEDEQANREGIETRLMWLSALSPTTRDSHARRHGRTYTRQEVQDFYSRDANAIHCKCSQVSVLVDSDGQISGKKLRKRLAERRDDYMAEAS